MDHSAAVVERDVASDGSRVPTEGSVPMCSPNEGRFKMAYLAITREQRTEFRAYLAGRVSFVEMLNPLKAIVETGRRSFGVRLLYNVVFPLTEPLSPKSTRSENWPL